MMHDLCVAALNADVVIVRDITAKLYELNKQLFIEANPIPVKWALAEMGKMPAGVRLPLTPLTSDSQKIVRAAMQTAGLL